ncbi:23S rRNA (pseudouridine(1915)-N(3))-methyltransferase [hydrothermal vent metagenome]|uniref:23S rRNA (Pseudouridine(1915)-N(3))-methyltransferase n=1 Tax=hydrothermal vent metagenome TaxID=652676 RepID=A0A3B0ZYU5_9ZZZZ
MPSWVAQGVDEYVRRMPKECQVKFVELPLGQRAKSKNIKQAMQQEEKSILAAIPSNTQVIALEITGRNWSTDVLANKMRDWMQSGKDVALLVGGPDGMTQACLDKAQEKWSLSNLTLPHPLVRIVLAEQLYRALMVIKNHPYHK